MKFTSAGTEVYIQKIQAVLAPVAISSLSSANPAVATVAGGDIAKFKQGDYVTVTGYTGDAAPANGSQIVGAVVGSTFVLTGVNLSAATGGPFTTGSARPQGAEPAITIVSMTNANPAVVTVGAGLLGALVEDQPVVIGGTGTVLDGRAYRATSVGTPSNTLTLEGADLSALAAPVIVGTVQPVPHDEMLRLCLTTFEWAKEPADSIDVSTMCGAEQLAGTPLPGNISIEGFIDFFEVGQAEWLLGTDDNTRRLLQVKVPSNGGGGDMLFIFTPSGFTYSMAVNEAVSFSAEGIVNTKPVLYVGASA